MIDTNISDAFIPAKTKAEPVTDSQYCRDNDPKFFLSDPAQRKKKNPDPTLCLKFDLINYHYNLEFVDSDLYFVKISVATGRVWIQSFQ